MDFQLPRVAVPPREVPWRIRRRLLDQRQWAALAFGMILIVAGGAVLVGIWLTDDTSGRAVGLIVGIITLLIGLAIVNSCGNLWCRRLRLLREGQLARAEIVACEEYEALRVGPKYGQARWRYIPTGRWIPFDEASRRRMVEWWNEPLPPVPSGLGRRLWFFAYVAIAASCLLVLGLLLLLADEGWELLTLAAFFGLFVLLLAATIRFVTIPSLSQAAPRERRVLLIAVCRFEFRLPDGELMVSQGTVDFSHFLDRGADDPFDMAVYDPQDPRNSLLFSTLSPPLRVGRDGDWDLAMAETVRSEGDGPEAKVSPPYDFTQRPMPQGDDLDVLLPRKVGPYRRREDVIPKPRKGMPIYANYESGESAIFVELGICGSVADAMRGVANAKAETDAEFPDVPKLFVKDGNVSCLRAVTPLGGFFAWTRGCYYFSVHAHRGEKELDEFVEEFPF